VATLAHPGSTWTPTQKDGSVLTFDANGKLLAEADRNGNAVTYTWGIVTFARSADGCPWRCCFILGNAHYPAMVVVQLNRLWAPHEAILRIRIRCFRSLQRARCPLGCQRGR
jgi:hypothetical protein